LPTLSPKRGFVVPLSPLTGLVTPAFSDPEKALLLKLVFFNPNSKYEKFFAPLSAHTSRRGHRGSVLVDLKGLHPAIIS
jgi:hypothetical protein